MGMAASQARLLSITARLHDVEYKAQNIESQKIQLATQKDALYENYLNALEATKVQVQFNVSGGTKFIDATFANLTTYNENRTTDYNFRDANSGKVIVDQETADKYNLYKNDKYMFAWAMMGFDGQMGWGREGSAYFVGRDDQSNENPLVTMCEVELEAWKDLNIEGSSDSQFKKIQAAYKELNEATNMADKKEALANFRKELYSNATIRNRIYDFMRMEKSGEKPDNFDEPLYMAGVAETLDENQFNFYVRKFENIQANGGCITIDAINEDGELGNDWVNTMLSSGRVLIDVYNKNKREWIETSVATSTTPNYLQEVEDNTNLKKAEAEYQHELDKINRKDTKFDQELSKLETERSALKTEMESIKKVKDDNIERTFGIFS